MADIEYVKVGSTTYNIRDLSKVSKSGDFVTAGTISMGATGLPKLDSTIVPANTLAIGRNGIGLGGIDTQNDGAAIFMENLGTTESNHLIFALGDDAVQGGTQDYMAFRYYDTSGNITYQTKVPFRNGILATTDQLTWDSISGKPSSMPASDVYSWAKASSKPSYSWSEIASRPTALSSFTNDTRYITSSGSCNYASSAGNADTLDGNHSSAFASASHSHSYLPLSGGTMSGTLNFTNNVGLFGIMGGGTDNWSITGIGADDNGVLKFTVADNALSDWMYFSFENYDGASYTPLKMTGDTILFNGKIGVGTSSPAYKLHVIGDVYANGGWLRSSGDSGWFNESYNGGWYMSDTSYVRSYNGKPVTAGGFIHTGYWDGRYALTSDGGATPISSMSVNYANSANYASSAGNADTLDGNHSSAFAAASHSHSYAGSSSAGGAATSANKLNTNAGSSTQPVYFSGGIPVACTAYSSASVNYASSANYATSAGSAGSASNADTLDGYHSSSFSFSSHSHGTLLWTNSSPSSAFANQTISLTLTNYKSVLIEYRAANDYAECTFATVAVGGSRISTWQRYSDSTTFRRRDAAATTTGVTFSNATSTTYVIPYKIYGL